MSLLAILSPAVVRPVVGLSALAALFFLFRPLIAGLLRGALSVLTPRRSHEERLSRRNMEGVMMINRMARDVHSTHPGLAAELRSIAARQ